MGCAPYRDLITSLRLDYDYDEGHTATTGRHDLTLDVHVDGRFLLSTDGRSNLRHARAHRERLLDLAVEQFGLKLTPPLPADLYPPPAIDLDQPEPDDDSSPDSLWWEWMASPWDPTQRRLGGGTALGSG